MLLGSQTLAADEAVKLDFDFESPRYRVRSIRLLLEVQSQDRAAEVRLDNLELIEWKTPLSPANEMCGGASIE